MPPPTKRARQAKLQRASGSKCFDPGLIEDDLEIFADPDFIPEVSDADNTNENCTDWSFSLLDAPNEVEEVSDDSETEEGTAEVQPGKRKERDDDSGKPDHADECASCAVQAAHEFWSKTLTLEGSSKQNQKKPLKKNRPTYSGASRSSFFAKQKVLRKAAEGSAKIDSFFGM
ncbi:hypothetical protein JB92DRAFT_2835867 [Gautieria morchelliformis]|nr:hypothetical protein JB92DRAFT_2835867 [Gautieria morchelliformis]